MIPRSYSAESHPPNISNSLTKREVENLSAGIQELDLKCAVYDWEALLPNDLIHAGFANFAIAVRSRVNSVVVAGRGAVECDLEANRLAVLRREPESGAGRGCGSGTPPCREPPAAPPPRDRRSTSQRVPTGSAKATPARCRSCASRAPLFRATRNSRPAGSRRTSPEIAHHCSVRPRLRCPIRKPYLSSNPAAPFSFSSFWMTRSISTYSPSP